MRYLLIAPFALTACSQIDDSRVFTGGSASGAANGYETFTSTAATTSTLGGVTLQTENSASTPVLRRNSGTLTHNTGETVISDGTYELVDGDGSQNGLITDGISVMVVTAAQGFSTNYDFARAYNQTYVANGTAYATQGITGVVTRTADMPSSGSAVWTGEADGSFSTSAGVVDLDDGTSRLRANFGSGSVTATLDGFTARSRSTGTRAAVPFDTIRIDGMVIRGNVFSGGTLTTTNAGAAVDVTGTRSEESIAGNFYGLNSNGVPDEVGGAANIVGANGALTTLFLAD